MYSLTYSGIIVIVLGYIFQLAGIPFVPADAEGAIKFIVGVVGVFMALYGRYRVGGINIFGGRKS